MFDDVFMVYLHCSILYTTFYFKDYILSIRERLKNDLNVFMKNRDELKVTSLRHMIGAVQNQEKSGKSEVVFTDEQIVGLISKEVKKRRDTAEEFMRVGAVERAERENAEAVFLSEYVPEQPSEEDVVAAVNSVLSGFDAPTMKDMGSVMRQVGDMFAGVPLDNKFVSGLVRSRLG